MYKIKYKCGICGAVYDNYESAKCKEQHGITFDMFPLEVMIQPGLIKKGIGVAMAASANKNGKLDPKGYTYDENTRELIITLANEEETK